MGKMNLLKAGYTSRVGETYGYRRKGTNIICAIPFSHAPHNAVQKKAFSAFSCLQKLAGVLARTFKNFMNLNYKNKNPINEIAHFLKGLIVNHIYTPSMIEHILPKLGYIEIEDVIENTTEHTITIKVKTENMSEDGKFDEYFFAIFNSSNELINNINFQSGEENIEITLQNPKDEQVYIIGFKSIFRNKKYIPCSGIFMPTKADVINGVWYLDRLTKYATITIENEILKITYDDAVVNNEILKINY